MWYLKDVDKVVDNHYFPVYNTRLCHNIPRKLNSFYDKKDYPISYPFKNPPTAGFLCIRENFKRKFKYSDTIYGMMEKMKFRRKTHDILGNH